MDLIKMVEALGGLPLAVLLILVIIGGHRGWWVYGRELQAEKERSAALLAAAHQREMEWRELAIGFRRTTERAVDLAKTSTTPTVRNE